MGGTNRIIAKKKMVASIIPNPPAKEMRRSHNAYADIKLKESLQHCDRFCLLLTTVK